MRKLVLLFLILFLAAFLRIWKLEEVPSGFHQDEVSQAYNAYSLLKTGKDRYGQAFPILFRTFGSYQPPIYTYLATVPVALLGNTIMSVRLVSAVAGTLSVFLTYLLIGSLPELKSKINLSLLGALMLAISPWAIHFSRLSVEANVSLTLFLLAFLLFIKSLNKVYLFPLVCLVFGLSTHAYYSARMIAPLFLFTLIIIFRKALLAHRKWLHWGVVLFGISLLPHIYMVITGAFTQRLSQVGSAFSLIDIFRHSLNYISPRHLFSDYGDRIARVSPGIAVFYGWMFIPFIAGLYFLFVNRLSIFAKILALLIVIALIPPSLTGDLFYPLRALVFLWTVTLIVGFGAYDILKRLGKSQNLVLITFALVSLIMFYYSYFILFKYDNATSFGYSYLKLIEIVDKYPESKIVIDSAREVASGLRISYFKYEDPAKVQAMLGSQMTTMYYTSNPVDNEVYRTGNIEVKPIVWGTDTCRANTILIGDRLTISDVQAENHKLNLSFVVDGIDGKSELYAYIPTITKCQN